MGLKPITSQEASRIQVKRGRESGTTLLVFPPVRDRGEPFVRELTVSNADRRVRKLQIYTEQPRDLIAEATPSDYQTVAAAATGSSGGPTCDLPVRMRLDWRRDQLSLDVALKEVEVNQFDHSMAKDIFVEPEIPGYARLNLAEMGGRSRPDHRTRTRQSMPPPGPREDVEMGQPTPIPPVEEPVVPSLGRSDPEPEPKPEVAYGLAPPSLEVVGAAGVASPRSRPNPVGRPARFPGPRCHDRTLRARSGDRQVTLLRCSAASRSRLRARARIGPIVFSGMPSFLLICR